MGLVELAVERDDGTSETHAPSVFVRCVRRLEAASKTPSLRLDLLDGPSIWTTDVRQLDKPTVLDCSATEYLRVLENAFSPSGTTADQKRFQFKWSRNRSTLTVLEHATVGNITMKYTTLRFSAVANDDDARWNALLHDITVVHRRVLEDVATQNRRVRELESVLATKDKLLEQALVAKQSLEDDLFTNFCAVLNAKKAEIARLQRELAMQSERAEPAEASRPSRKAARPAAARKTRGAKLSRSRKNTKSDDEEDEHNESDGSDQEAQRPSQDSGPSDDESGRNHVDIVKSEA
ncbi:hypothetical protein PINS_up021814, partial [Pythium insidiosum]